MESNIVMSRGRNLGMTDNLYPDLKMIGASAEIIYTLTRNKTQTSLVRCVELLLLNLTIHIIARFHKIADLEIRVSSFQDTFDE
jgi:hypothetical protein